MASHHYDEKTEDEVILRLIGKQFDDPTLADLTVKCGDLQVYVHRIIVTAHSEWFRKACMNSGFKEANSPLIELHEDDAVFISAMLKFMYESDYEDNEDTEDPAAVGPMTFNVSMFSIAEKYFVSALSKFALDRVAYHVHYNWNVADFAAAIRVAYAITSDLDKHLKNALLGATKTHADELFADSGVDSRFIEVADSVPGYSADLIRAHIGKRLAKVKEQGRLLAIVCPACSHSTKIRCGDGPVLFKCGDWDCTYKAKMDAADVEALKGI